MKTALIKPDSEGKACLPSLYTPVIPARMPESRHRDVKVRRLQAARIDAPKPGVMQGITLIELTVVLLVLVALAGLTLPMYTNTPRYAQCVATDATMANIRDAIMGSGGMAGYRSDMGIVPHPDSNGNTVSSLNDLFNNPLYFYNNGLSSPYSLNNPPFNQPYPSTQTPSAAPPTPTQTTSFNPTTQRGWRGPYMSGGITCATIAGLLNKMPTGYSLPSTIDNQIVCGFSGTPPTITYATSNTVALDSFPVIATDNNGNTMLPLQGSPIVLMPDASGNYFLVSGGPTGGIQINPGSMGSRTNIDDRVLYLNAVDPGSNQPCS